jgi:biotin synthase
MDILTMSVARYTQPENALEFIRRMEDKAMANLPLAWEEALDLMNLDTVHIYDLIASANRVRRRFKGDEISICSIINAKSGQCPEDCSFCSQSSSAKTSAPVFDLIPAEKIIEGARAAQANGARKYGVVTSGYGFAGKGSKKVLGGLVDHIAALKQDCEVHRCASLGIIDEAAARELKAAGLEEYHHNLETARSFFPNVCTTHDYEEDVATVRAAKSAGLRVCCGGIFGLGETSQQRVEMAFTLRELDVDSIPLNFLNPIKGTRLENQPPLPPLELLKIIAVYRLLLPTKDIKAAGGREKNLRDLQCLVFAAGANSTMVGNYLTTCGRPAGEDLAMIRDLGLTVKEP